MIDIQYRKSLSWLFLFYEYRRLRACNALTARSNKARWRSVLIKELTQILPLLIQRNR